MTAVRGACAALVLAGALLGPASAAPTPPLGFHSTGTLVLQATISGAAVNLGGNVAIYRSGSRYRLDLLTLGIPGADPSTSAIAGALLAPGGVSLIFDGTDGTIEAYSNASRVYYLSGPMNVSGGQAPGPGPTSAPVGAADPLAALAGVTRQLRDVVHASIVLTGHSTTNGHPTADLDITVARQPPGGTLQNYHAQIALADDLDGFPVRIAISRTPASPEDFHGSANSTSPRSSAKHPILGSSPYRPGTGASRPSATYYKRHVRAGYRATGEWGQGSSVLRIAAMREPSAG